MDRAISLALVVVACCSVPLAAQEAIVIDIVDPHHPARAEAVSGILSQAHSIIDHGKGSRES